MKVYGKILDTIPNDRIVKILTKNKIIFLYMSRKLFKDFGPYFYDKPYVFINVKDERKRYGKFLCNEITSFIKIVQNTTKDRKIFYDISLIRKGVRNLLNKKQNKIFIDLEFSLPSYHQNKSYVSEIVQYGIVIEDEEGNIILEDRSLVQPTKGYSLNKRTLKFLSKSKEDFEDAAPYIEFYQLIEKYINQYDAKIIAWGKNDILTIEQSFKINRLQPLDVRNRYINLMQVMKNYYNLKNDLGLFDTYSILSGIEQEPQSHDALEDAMIAREIFRIFKMRVNEEAEDLEQSAQLNNFS